MTIVLVPFRRRTTRSATPAAGEPLHHDRQEGGRRLLQQLVRPLIPYRTAPPPRPGSGRPRPPTAPAAPPPPLGPKAVHGERTSGDCRIITCADQPRRSRDKPCASHL